MSHPDAGYDKFADLPKATDLSSAKDALVSVYRMAEERLWFQEDNVKPYTFNPAPFITNKKSVQQGYVDFGALCDRDNRAASSRMSSCSPITAYRPYSTTIEARARSGRRRIPISCSASSTRRAIGWYHYLYGDNSKANALIKRGQSRASPTTRSPIPSQSLKEIWHRRFRRRAETRHRRDDRCADEGFLRRRWSGAALFTPDLDYKKSYTLPSSIRVSDWTCARSHERDAGRAQRHRQDFSKRHAGARWSRSRGPRRRIANPARAVGMRKIHGAAPHREAGKALVAARCKARSGVPATSVSCFRNQP